MSNPSHSPRCPVRTTFDLVGGKWHLLLLNHLGQEPLTYSELRARLAPISDKVLTNTLHHLTENKLVERNRNQYRRTAAGRASDALLAAVVNFGTEYEQLARSSRLTGRTATAGE